MLQTRRALFGQLGSLALVGGAAWLFREQILWRAPQVRFTGPEPSSGWLPFASRRSAAATIRIGVGDRMVRALVDSGAQYSVIDKAFAAELGLPGRFAAPLMAYGVAGRPQIGRAASLPVQIGNLVLPELRAAVLDLGPLADAAGLRAPVVIGQDVLHELVADIDFPGRRMRLTAQGAYARPDGAIAVPARRKGRALLTEVHVEGARLEPTLDTGASSPLVLAADVAEAAGLLNGRPVKPASSLVLGGVASGRMVTVETLAFGGEVLRHVPVHIYERQPVPGFPSGLLGVGALRGFRALLDHAAGQLHLVKR